MDLITGKALKLFNEWLFKTHGLYLYNVFNQTLLHAMVIEFFDSVGILIFPRRFTHLLKYDTWYYIITNKEGVHLNNYLEDRITEDSRHQATQEAIKKAVEIYNKGAS